jgi:hypothetical protein
MVDELSQQPIKVDLVGTDGTSELGDWASKVPFSKAMTARWIARWIVALSAVSIMTILLLGFILVFLLRHEPATAKQLIQDAIIPLMEKAATFFTTVFGPLLAFILGFYFGERQAQRRSTD